jgi:hypothetical protein
VPSTATAENSGKPFIFSYFVDDLVWWLFWVGIYVDPKDSSAFASHFPMYILITLFVLEKVFQRWLTNRYGCDLKKVREFKILEEKIKRYEVEEIKQKMAQDILTNKKDGEEESKKEGESKIDINKLVIGALKIKKKQLNERGEEIVDVKEKLTNYLSQVSLKNFDNPEFITKNEAKRERRRIERLFTYETDVQ